MTPTEQFILRLTDAIEMADLNEREACRLAGIPSESQIGAARSRKSAMNWNHVAALTAVLEGKGISRDWLLWGIGPRLSGELVRLGIGVEAIDPKTVVPKLKNRGKQARGATTNVSPAPAKNSVRPKRAGLGNIDGG